MTISQVLHRRKSVGATDQLPSAPDYIPPSLLDPDDPDGPPGLDEPWPPTARTVVVVLVVAMLLATFGAALALRGRDDGSAERLLQEQVGALTIERDQALASAVTLEAQIAAVRQELAAARAAGDQATADITALEDRIDVLSDQRAAAVAAADEASVALEAAIERADAADAELDEAIERADALGAEVATERARVAAARAERDALAGLFPADVAEWLTDADTIGTYRVSATQAYCAGSPSCGTTPAIADVTIRKAAAGNLVVSVPGYAEAGLFRANGAYHGVAQSTSAVPACDGAARVSSLAITLWGSRFDVGTSQRPDVAALTGSLVVDSPALGDCPSAMVVHSLRLTPRS